MTYTSFSKPIEFLTYFKIKPMHAYRSQIIHSFSSSNPPHHRPKMKPLTASISLYIIRSNLSRQYLALGIKRSFISRQYLLFEYSHGTSRNITSSGAHHPTPQPVPSILFQITPTRHTQLKA